MKTPICSRRDLLTTAAAATTLTVHGFASAPTAAADSSGRVGSQRLPLDRLRRWESLGYGMFIHFGMSTFVGKELPSGQDPADRYAPDQLDVDQWISVARDAGMKYAVLTAKHVAGHCLWPSKHTDYTVAHSGNKTNVVEAFVRACEKRGLLPGLYYCSWDNHHLFGSVTPSMTRWHNEMNSFPRDPSAKKLPPFTTSLYQNFQTAQVTELLTQFGPIGEIWIDIPGVLGRGYRTFLYQHIATRQPEAVVMMNSGIGDGSRYDIAYAWPSDLIAIERKLPPEAGHEKWRTIEGKRYYLPGEVCDPIGKHWFFADGDPPRAEEELRDQLLACRQRGVNFLLNVPPNRHGRIPDPYVAALMRLRKNAGI